MKMLKIRNRCHVAPHDRESPENHQNQLDLGLLRFGISESLTDAGDTLEDCESTVFFAITTVGTMKLMELLKSLPRGALL